MLGYVGRVSESAHAGRTDEWKRGRHKEFGPGMNQTCDYYDDDDDFMQMHMHRCCIFA